MKLAYLTNYFPSLTETFIYREVMELQRRNYSIDVYSLRKPDRNDISQEAVGLYDATRYLLPIDVLYLCKCHLKYLFGRPLRYVMTLCKMLTGTHKNLKGRIRSLMHFGEGVVLADMMSKAGVTHIHSHYASQSTSVARVIHLLAGLPYSFTGHAHDIWHDQLLLPQKLAEAKFVVTCSHFGRQWLLKQIDRDVSGKVHVVYHGLDTRKFTPPVNEKRKKNLVLSVGRLDEIKGHPDLIRACAILRDKNFDFECAIVGEGPMRSELEKLVAACQLEEYVKLIGALPQEEIITCYQSAWVFALPCVTVNDGRQDGLPNVLMEAMSCGLPVITTKCTAQTELIEHERNGLLISPHQPEELANAIMELCEDVGLRDLLRMDARLKMEQEFDNQKTIEPLLRLYDQYL
ncbi:glycosyltransferase family 4 protein [Geomobilimonas luticola]|uniref:Glycosyltransferase family 4 protein n=1 Tax=Geomobilimonas luticola TaxID=1114878 RepID=A0ABS5SFY9_9BACT|nr:glycosyltransferase family 4 protein [Geomobilimonas luticola]MBT0652932.1 glycosyltransferase family 4 protein [Geomobilimonas luticola]